VNGDGVAPRHEVFRHRRRCRTVGVRADEEERVMGFELPTINQPVTVRDIRGVGGLCVPARLTELVGEIGSFDEARDRFACAAVRFAKRSRRGVELSRAQGWLVV
jgi:hypothetical protein